MTYARDPTRPERGAELFPLARTYPARNEVNDLDDPARLRPRDRYIAVEPRRDMTLFLPMTEDDAVEAAIAAASRSDRAIADALRTQLEGA